MEESEKPRLLRKVGEDIMPWGKKRLRLAEVKEGGIVAHHPNEQKKNTMPDRRVGSSVQMGGTSIRQGIAKEAQMESREGSPGKKGGRVDNTWKRHREEQYRPKSQDNEASL